ncbi:hypothetical protein [Desulfohalovibrio reitneri]|uniref:hypothetical protein n=1 Tax=Desulfohalovibrio reitneri TaxID=1307759 RepID=UPI0004A77246|nr:hypothetical protein [Desulfohalovibrio reitneri]
MVIPTGEEKNGLGGGVTKLEPYLAWGQIWPLWDVFTHAQVGYAHVMGNPSDRDVNDEWFWRTAVGRTFTFGRFGRTVTPMVEFVGQEEIGRNTPTEWDVVPQVQIPLNRRQHVRLGLGVRYPLNNYQTRDHRYMAYLLWDWFDGGFFEGW